MKDSRANSRLRPTTSHHSDEHASPQDAQAARFVWLFPVLFAFCLAYSLWAASQGWNHTINDRHSFRQSQTATTALYLIQKPFQLAYETPVLGKPWAIPMEFPIYQLLVAKLVESTDFPIDRGGRLVSLFFFILTCVPLYFLFRQAGVSAQHAWLPLVLFILSPFYIFWSRTFMIESTALFFSVSYLAASVQSIRKGNFLISSLAVFSGMAAALTKVTTFLVYWPWVGLFLLDQGWRTWNRAEGLRSLRKPAWLCFFLVGIPFASGLLWVHYCDGIKSANPLAAAYLTSTCPHSSSWNYGTWEQKFSGPIWEGILGRFYELFGPPHLGWLLLGSVLVLSLLQRKRFRETIACLGGYLLAPAIFTNLHAVHDYYANANGIFLIAAAAFALVGLWEESRTKLAGALILALFCGSAFLGHRLLYAPLQQANNREILDVAEKIRSVAPQDSVLICIGNDWSPLVSYYAQRRALNFPIDDKTPPALFAQSLENLKNESIGAIIFLSPVTYPRELALEQLHSAGIRAPLLEIQDLPRF